MPSEKQIAGRAEQQQTCFNCKKPLSPTVGDECPVCCQSATLPNAEELWKAIEDANEALLDIGFGNDVEHQIAFHADGVPDVLRRYGTNTQKAVDALQVVIHARLDAAEERARKAKG